jgi:DNA modification methylase
MIGEYKLNEIYNEDSYEAIKKIPDKSVDCIYVDVPYEYVNGGTSESELGDRFAKKRKILKEKNIYSGFDYKLLDEFIRIMKNINIFIWCSRLQLLDIMNYFSDKNCNFELLTWNKTNPQPGCNNTWLSDVEYCLYFREVGKVKLNDGYELKSKWYVSPINKKDKDLFTHPTIKPLELVKRHLLHTTQENDIVADFFLGSGTTCVAAKELNRRYIGFEIDKDYYKIAKDRLNGITANGQMSIFTDVDKLEQESLF